MSASESPDEASYAMSLADGSYAWYRLHAIRARRLYMGSETLVLVLAASIPVSAAIWPDRAVPPAVLGALVVVLTGTRSIFHWQENYLRFSKAREAVEAERRLFLTGSSTYADPTTRDAALAARVTAIEQEETAGWMKTASQRPNVGTDVQS